MHPKLAVDEFDNQLLSLMLEKVSFENKEVCLIGDKYKSKSTKL